MIKRNDMDGLLFFDKKTGYNFLLDEIDVEYPDIAPRHVSIALTTACNLTCEHCYITHDNQQLTIEQVKKWVDILSANGCLSIGLGGGEPTLWEHLDELLDYIGLTQMAVTLTTNGSADYIFYKKILPKVNLLRFSFDGFSDVYESYRKQSYVDLKEKVALLKKESNGQIGLNYLLTNDTIKQLDYLVDAINTVQPAEVLLIPLLSKAGEKTLSNQSINIIRKWVEDNQTCFPISFSYSSIDIVKDFALPIQNFEPEKQKNYFLHINAKGNLMKSVFDPNPVLIGNSLKEALIKI